MNKIQELEKGISHIIVDEIEYQTNSFVSKTILRKITGTITATSVAVGAELSEKFVPFDTYIQIIEGVADLILNEKRISIYTGECIVIPAHAKHSFIANVPFKMISTTIKSGYEE